MALREEGFWHQHYELELKNYNDNGDEGEVWFGRGLSKRIANWIIKRLSSQLVQVQPINLLDIGCGNGFFIKTLLEDCSLNHPNSSKSVLHITGIDYSHQSIELSRKILESVNLHEKIRLEICDFLDKNQVERLVGEERFDLLVDIGTFDAICLIANKSETSLEDAKIKYMTSIYSLAHESTIFILASCNHTEEELMHLFSIDCASKFRASLLDRVESPKLQFGGKQGSQVTCIILQFSNKQDSQG